MTPRTIAAVVVQYGPEGACADLLEDLRASEGVDARPFVIDHGASPSGRLAELAAASRGDYAWDPANPGFAGGANRGLRAALAAGGADMYALLNPDVRLDRSCLRDLFDLVAGDAAIGLAGPGLLQAARPGTWWNVGGEIEWPSGRPRSWLHGTPRAGDAPGDRDADFVCGTVLAIAPRCLKEVGFLPEDYFLYFEDAEYSYRARACGFRTVVRPSALAWHAGEGSPETVPGGRAYYRARNRLHFSRRWNPCAVRGAVHRSAFASREILRSLAKWMSAPRRQALLPALGVLHYWRGLRGKAPGLSSSSP